MLLKEVSREHGLLTCPRQTPCTKAGHVMMRCMVQPFAGQLHQLSLHLIPQDGAGSPKDVFLYTKAHLRQQVTLPEPETVVLPRVDGKPSQLEIHNFVGLS